MTNPNATVRLHSRNGGRGSVYEANQWAQVFDEGILSGTGAVPAGDMEIRVGGTLTCPDIVVAKNPTGYKIALDLVSYANLELAAPASNSVIAYIVAYTNDLDISSEQTTVTGNPASCGLIVVYGTEASSPVPPTDSEIRTAITADGAVGTNAAYSAFAKITLSSTTEEITTSQIENINAFFERVTTTDPGEGVPLAPNHFIDVVSGS